MVEEEVEKHHTQAEEQRWKFIKGKQNTFSIHVSHILGSNYG